MISARHKRLAGGTFNRWINNHENVGGHEMFVLKFKELFLHVTMLV